jgi:hypothetical protein
MMRIFWCVAEQIGYALIPFFQNSSCMMMVVIDGAKVIVLGTHFREKVPDLLTSHEHGNG